MGDNEKTLVKCWVEDLFTVENPLEHNDEIPFSEPDNINWFELFEYTTPGKLSFKKLYFYYTYTYNNKLLKTEIKVPLVKLFHIITLFPIKTELYDCKEIPDTREERIKMLNKLKEFISDAFVENMEKNSWRDLSLLRKIWLNIISSSHDSYLQTIHSLNTASVSSIISMKQVNAFKDWTIRIIEKINMKQIDCCNPSNLNDLLTEFPLSKKEFSNILKNPKNFGLILSSYILTNKEYFISLCKNTKLDRNYDSRKKFDQCLNLLIFSLKILNYSIHQIFFGHETYKLFNPERLSEELLSRINILKKFVDTYFEFLIEIDMKEISINKEFTRLPNRDLKEEEVISYLKSSNVKERFIGLRHALREKKEIPNEIIEELLENEENYYVLSHLFEYVLSFKVKSVDELIEIYNSSNLYVLIILFEKILEYLSNLEHKMSNYNIDEDLSLPDEKTVDQFLTKQVTIISSYLNAPTEMETDFPLMSSYLPLIFTILELTSNLAVLTYRLPSKNLEIKPYELIKEIISILIRFERLVNYYYLLFKVIKKILDLKKLNNEMQGGSTPINNLNYNKINLKTSISFFEELHKTIKKTIDTILLQFL